MRSATMIVAACLTAFPLSAQSLSFGLKLGPNTAHQVGWCCGEENPFNSRPGLSGGVSATLQLIGPVGLQTEVLYAGKGVQGTDHFRMRLNYLEVPILVRLAPSIGSHIHPVGLIGLAPALELSCTGQDRPLSIPENPAPLEPLNCSYYRTSHSDLGLVGALGADIRVSAVYLTVELRRTHGLRNLTSEWPDLVRTTNRSTAILFGARLGSRH